MGGGRIPIQLKVRLTRVEGTLLAWIPPPPGDRLWSAFVKLPHLDIDVKPVVRFRASEQVHQRTDARI